MEQIAPFSPPAVVDLQCKRGLSRPHRPERKPQYPSGDRANPRPRKRLLYGDLVVVHDGCVAVPKTLLAACHSGLRRADDDSQTKP